MQTCDECSKWKRKTEKLASKYFETISGMKSEIKQIKRDTACKIKDAEREIKDKLSSQLKVSLLKIQRKDDVLREELQAVRIERSRSGSMASRSLRNRSTIVDETIMPYLGSVKNSITTASNVNPHANGNTLQPTLNIESYHLARQGKASDPNFYPQQPVEQTDESGFIETEPSRHDFSYEKIETCRNPLTDDPV